MPEISLASNIMESSFDILKYICDDLAGLEKDFSSPNSLDFAPRSNGPPIESESHFSQVEPMTPIQPFMQVSSSSEDLEETQSEVGTQQPLCPICNDVAGKHFYYGVQACISCRGFFQRSVRNRFHLKFICCKGTQNCRITARSRKNCKWCRFQKCLQSGMKTCYVMTHDKSGLPPKSKLILPIKAMVKTANLSQIFTEHEVDKALSIYKNLLSFGYRSYYQLFSQNEQEFMTFLRALNDQGGGPSMISEAFTETNKQATINYFFSIDDMASLTPFDRMTLISHNFPSIFGLLWSVYSYTPDLCTFYEEFLKHGYEFRDREPEIDKILMVFEANQLLGKKPKNLTIDVTFRSNSATQDLIQRHDNLVHEVNSGLRESSQSSADYIIVMLLSHIIMFATEFAVSLQDKAKIQATQEKYLVLLHRYLRTHYQGRARAKLSETMMIFEPCRQVFETFHERIFKTRPRGGIF
uniref:Nuclear receptor n=1 Tax=Tigriopus japonicus TaxID=158387 RepID=A0A0A7CIW5_TIGJA|nr:nuclear receptor [Tigriopus japonicus]